MLLRVEQRHHVVRHRSRMEYPFAKVAQPTPSSDPTFDFPAGGMKIGRRFSDVTTSCDQNSRHGLEHGEAKFGRFASRNPSCGGQDARRATAKMAEILGGRDFNLVKHGFLKGPNLFQPD